MFTKHQISTRTTTDGLKVVIMPRYALAGYHLVNGALSSVKQPSSRIDSETGFNYFSTLFGLNLEDFDRIKPDRVYYALGDGSYLMATADKCLIADRTEHRATSDGKPCFKHQIADLVIAQMPEVEEVEELPVYQF